MFREYIPNDTGTYINEEVQRFQSQFEKDWQGDATKSIAISLKRIADALEKANDRDTVKKSW